MPGERGFSFLLGKNPNEEANLSKGDDTEMPKKKDFRADGKHVAAKAMIDAHKAGDHEGLSAALEDWHALHEESGPDADFDPENTEPT